MTDIQKHNARVVRGAVRGKSKTERLYLYDVFRWGLYYPLKLAADAVRAAK